MYDHLVGKGKAISRNANRSLEPHLRVGGGSRNQEKGAREKKKKRRRKERQDGGPKDEIAEREKTLGDKQICKSKIQSGKVVDERSVGEEIPKPLVWGQRPAGRRRNKK